jgi:modulator of FtsH protease
MPDPYQQQLWHDFFLATSGASAALAGLLFVAISLHVRYIATSATHRGMSRGSLIGLVNVLVLSFVALVPQPPGWLGLELVVVGAGYVALGAAYQLVSRWRSHSHLSGSSLWRSSFGYLLGIAGVIGGLSISFRTGPGLYLLAVILVVVLVWSLWDAWVLLMGVADEEIAAESAGQ